MTEEITEAIRNAFNEYLNAVDKIILENQALQIELQRLEQENKELKKFFDSAAKKNTSLENKIKEYHEQYDELYWTTDQLVKDKTKLKQTLEEIKHILEFHKDELEECLHNDIDGMIQNKINEALG